MQKLFLPLLERKIEQLLEGALEQLVQEKVIAYVYLRFLEPELVKSLFV